MNKAAVNVLIHAFSGIYALIFVGCTPSSGISESQAGACIASGDVAKHNSKVVISRLLFGLKQFFKGEELSLEETEC